MLTVEVVSAHKTTQEHTANTTMEQVIPCDKSVPHAVYTLHLRTLNGALSAYKVLYAQIVCTYMYTYIITVCIHTLSLEMLQ